jgi:mono/diheme cytochrome c family protein
MVRVQILGLFHEATPTADTIEQLRKLGVPDGDITVMSNMPYRPEMLGRPRPRRRVWPIALVGGGLGLLTGLFLTAGIFLLYPLEQGGQPIVPVPPSLIILFEVTMLGTMWAAFFGLLGENRFPLFKSPLYDPRITEGHIGVRAEVDDALAVPVENILTVNGAHHLQRAPGGGQTNTRLALFWGTVLALIVSLGVVALLAGYGIISLAIPTQMADQESIADEQGPRLAAPASAVPVQGPVLIAGQPATAPLPATPQSLQRGQILFGMTCAVCHGPSGTGDGKLSGFFAPRPADLSSERVQGLSDAELFLIISQGRGIMPSLAENFSAGERWDVINYVRTLKK